MSTSRSWSPTVALAVVALAGAAHAASITVMPDAATYLVGDTITLAIVFDSEGEATIDVVADLRFDPSLVTFQSASVETAASFGGGLPWTVGGTQGTVQDQVAPAGGETLVAISQLGCLGVCAWQDTTGDPEAIVGTYQFSADAVGTAHFFWTSVFFFSADETSPSVTGAVAQIVPEPTPAALLGLGLCGLAAAGRREPRRRP